MATQLPSIGRMVHYVSYGTPGGDYAPEHRAAIITELSNAPEGFVGLCVVNPTGIFFHRAVRHDPACGPGSWHWPEYVPAVAAGQTPALARADLETFFAACLPARDDGAADLASFLRTGDRSFPCLHAGLAQLAARQATREDVATYLGVYTAQWDYEASPFAGLREMLRARQD